MLLRAIVLVFAASLLVVGVGCSKKDCTTLRGGGCTPGSDHCGAVLQCGERKLDFKCDVPAAGAALSFPLTCKCIEDGVEKKTAKLASAPMGLDDGALAAKSACGW